MDNIYVVVALLFVLGFYDEIEGWIISFSASLYSMFKSDNSFRKAK